MKFKRKCSTIFIILLAVFIQSALANTETNQIQTLIAEGKLQQALKETDKYLARDKKNVGARFLKGLVLTKLNQFDDAESIYLELTKEHPELPEPYNNLAVIYAAQGKYEKARLALQEAINTHPNYATAHENIGDVYAKLASQAYTQALHLDKGNETVREKLSLIGDLFPPPPAPVDLPDVTTKEQEHVAELPKKEVGQEAPVNEIKKVTMTPTKKVPRAEEANRKDIEIEESLIIGVINNWASAWSNKDVDSYLSFYAEDFIPPDDLTKHEWKALLEEQLSKTKFISVDVIQPTVKLYGNDHAQVFFSQSYQSDTYKDQVNKILLMKKVNSRWFIIEEKSR